MWVRWRGVLVRVAAFLWMIAMVATVVVVAAHQEYGTSAQLQFVGFAVIAVIAWPVAVRWGNWRSRGQQVVFLVSTTALFLVTAAGASTVQRGGVDDAR